MDDKIKHIADKVKSHREEVDMGELWTNIESHIPKEKKRKNRIWIFFLLGLISFVGFQWSNSSIEEDKTPLEQIKPDNNIAEVQKTLTNEKQTDAPVDNSLFINTKDLQKTEKEAQTQNPTSNALEFSSSTIATKNNTKSTNIYKSTDAKTIDYVMFTGVETLQNSVDRVDEETQTKKDIQDSEGRIEHLSEAETLKAKNSNISFPFVPFLNIDNLKSNLMAITIDKEIDQNVAPLKEISRKARIPIYANIGIGLPDATYSEANVEGSTNAAFLDRSIVPVLMVSAEVGTSIKIYDRFNFIIGLNASNIIEKADFTTNYSVFGTEGETETGTIIYQDGSIQPLIESTTPEFKRAEHVQWVNNLTQIEIPLGVEVELSKHSAYRLTAGIGAGLVVYQQYSGKTIKDELSASYDANFDKKDIYKSSGGWNPWANITAHFPMNETSSFNIGLNYRQKSKINTENTLVAHTYKSFGLDIGVRKFF